uniref:Pur-alpha n=1 Tax=Romanomermis culicivorax TaxID=13658 RepID=A0A915KJQ6_ROMCU
MSNDEGRNNGIVRERSRRGPAPDEQELATKMLHIQSKRIYLDVKENHRGRFLKIAESSFVWAVIDCLKFRVGASGRKSRLVMSIPVAIMFQKCLEEFSEFCSALDPPANTDASNNNGFLKSKIMRRKNRRYFVDLKENNRGRFLRVTQTTTDSDGQRSHIALPVQGIDEFKSNLAELLSEYGHDANDGSVSPSRLPEGTQIRSERKMLYFDIGQNERGIFMRITEVKREIRNSVTIPESSWHTMSNFFAETCQKMETLKVQPEKAASVSDSSPVLKNVDTAADAAAAPQSAKSASPNDRLLGEQNS